MRKLLYSCTYIMLYKLYFFSTALEISTPCSSTETEYLLCGCCSFLVPSSCWQTCSMDGLLGVPPIHRWWMWPLFFGQPVRLLGSMNRLVVGVVTCSLVWWSQPLSTSVWGHSIPLMGRLGGLFNIWVWDLTSGNLEGDSIAVYIYLYLSNNYF